MTVAVAGHWEIGYNTPIIEANYWNFPLRDFEVPKWLMTPVSGISHNQKTYVDLEEFTDYNSMLNSCTDLVRVFVEPRTQHENPDTIWLHDFEHPQDCVYVFGSAHYNPTIAHLREQDFVVTIKTVQDRGVLWAHQCFPLVLHDRLVKSWQ